MDGYFRPDFPAEKSQAAVRAEQLRFPAVPEPVLDLKEMTADLAFDLRAFFAVVEVEIAMGRIAAQADDLIRDLWGVSAGFYGPKGLAVNRLVLG
jgi:hypothetical protein